jgi:hypothetical protein
VAFSVDLLTFFTATGIARVDPGKTKPKLVQRVRMTRRDSIAIARGFAARTESIVLRGRALTLLSRCLRDLGVCEVHNGYSP